MRSTKVKKNGDVKEMQGVMKMVTLITAASVVAATGLVLTSEAARRTAKQMASAVENAGQKMGNAIDRM